MSLHCITRIFLTVTLIYLTAPSARSTTSYFSFPASAFALSLYLTHLFRPLLPLNLIHLGQPIRPFLFHSCCNYKCSCNFSQQLLQPTHLDSISVFVAYLASRQNFYRRASRSNHHQNYFNTLSGFSSKTACSTFTVHTLGLRQAPACDGGEFRL